MLSSAFSAVSKARNLYINSALIAKLNIITPIVIKTKLIYGLNKYEILLPRYTAQNHSNNCLATLGDSRDFNMWFFDRHCRTLAQSTTCGLLSDN